MTKIEWTQRPGTNGETWNPIRARNKKTGGVGHFCTKVSAGCQNCYAADFQKRFNNPVRYAAQDADQVELFLDEVALMKPLHWKKPRTIFVCSMTDLFYEGHDSYWIRLIWGVMALCPHHTFIVLTKRPERMLACLESSVSIVANNIAKFMDDRDAAYEQVVDAKFPLENVWLGVSVEDQKTAEERIPDLLRTKAAVKFLSVEPLLGAIDLTRLDDGMHDGVHLYLDCLSDYADDGHDGVDGIFGATINWVIVGGESGHNARPMHPDWARSLRDQCNAAEVPFFFKQWGAWAPHMLHQVPAMSHELIEMRSISSSIRKERGKIFFVAGRGPFKPAEVLKKSDKKSAGRSLDGVEHNEWPEVKS